MPPASAQNSCRKALHSGGFIMFERAFRNIETVAGNEIYPGAKTRRRSLGLSAEEYFDGLMPAVADRAKPLLERVNVLGEEPAYTAARARFAAAVSGLPDGISRLRNREYFAQVAEVELGTFLAEISSLTEEDWAQDVRHNIRVQRETRAISIMARTARAGEPRHNQYVHPDESYAPRMPGLMNWLLDFAATTGGGTLQLARVVSLRGGGQVYRHIDRGLYYVIRDRYHLVLKSSGSRMQCGDQVSVWAPGEVWWFNNHIGHRAFNDGETDRIHVIFDVLPRDAGVLAPYFQECSDYVAQPMPGNSR
jgi:hypothetical protein